MINEKKIKHNLQIDVSMYNSCGVLTPSAYQRMIMNMIEEHLDMVELGETYLMEKYGISWVLLSTSIELKRKISPSDKLVGVTWHAGGRVPSFRRDFYWEDEKGEVVAVGATLSALFDAENRKLCMDRNKLSVVYLDAGEPMLERVDRKMKLVGDLELIETRRVRPSQTDGIGHVNNTKYGDFVYDAMTAAERARLCDLSRLDVWFLYELREGDEFTVAKDMGNVDTLAFVGSKVGESRPAFEMRIEFRK